MGTIIEGESLLNDGTAIVMYKVLYVLVMKDDNMTIGRALYLFLWNAVGGPVLGLVVGYVIIRWVGVVFNDPYIEVTATISAAYMTFWLAETEAVSVSGVLAIMSLGIYMNYHRTAISPEVERLLHGIWNIMEYLANTLIFLLVRRAPYRWVRCPGPVQTRQSSRQWESLGFLHMMCSHVDTAHIRSKGFTVRGVGGGGGSMPNKTLGGGSLGKGLN